MMKLVLSLQRRGDGRLELLLGLGIDGAGRLVQNEDRGIGDQRARKRDQLLLTGGQAIAALAHLRIVSVLQLRG